MHRAPKIAVALACRLRMSRQFTPIPPFSSSAHLPTCQLTVFRWTSTISPSPALASAQGSMDAPPTSPVRTTLKTISRMCREKAPWRLIAQETGLSVEECQRLFYTKLDWRVRHYWTVDGNPRHPDKEQIARLMYLVEQEKRSFDEIADLNLLSKRVDAKRYIRYYHPWVLEKKYSEIVRYRRAKRRQQLATIYRGDDEEDGGDDNHEIQQWLFRSVELFGQDWQRVAEQTNAEMAKAREELREQPVSELEYAHSAGHAAIKSRQGVRIEQAEAVLTKFDKSVQEQEAQGLLTAEMARAMYRKMQLKGLGWTVEDDTVLVYMVLETMRQRGWLNLSQVPIAPSEARIGGYWEQVADAVGNHSPQQCATRWQAMIIGGDSAKKWASSSRWHPLEECRYWMVWDFFTRQPKIIQRIQENLKNALMAGNSKVSLPTHTQDQSVHEATEATQSNTPKAGIHWAAEGSAMVSEEQRQRQDGLFLSKREISRIFSLGDLATTLQSNRTADQCQELFEKAVAKMLARSAMGSRKMEQTPRTNAVTVLNDAIQTQNAQRIINYIRTAFVDPLLTRTLQKLPSPGTDASTKEEHSKVLATVPRDRRLRSFWGPALRNQLSWLVLEAKEGVKIPDEDLEWDKIALQLEKEVQKDKSHAQQRVPTITPQQCLSTWRYTMLECDNLEAEHMTDELPDQLSSSQKHGNTQQPWLDHEIISLELGVRRFGSSWADIRAQYLPRHQTSDIYKKWFEISDNHKNVSGGGAASASPTVKPTVDRTSEDDYQALMRAIKISTKP